METKMKRLLLLSIAVILVPQFARAELAESHRYFEMGVDVQAGISNNYLGLTDILVKELVIDFQKMEREVPDDGLTFDYTADADYHMSLDINKYFRGKLFFGVDGSGYANIGHELFEILGKGVKVNESKSIGLSLYGDLFLDAGISYKTDIKGFGVRVEPAVYMPLVHVADTSAKLKYTSNKAGLIRADAEIPVDIYTIVDMDGFKKDQVTMEYVSNAISEAIRNIGFDLFLEVEHKITRTFEMGGFTRIPIVPGKLDYVASTRYWAYAEQSNFLGYLNDTNSFKSDSGHDEFTYSKKTAKVHRPFILGAEGAWRPFGPWCTFRPKMDMVIRNPYSPEWQIFGEYALSVDFRFLKVVGLHFATRYENLVFSQVMGFSLNTRIVELDIKAALRGGDFANSFDLSGASVQLGLKFGF